MSLSGRKSYRYSEAFKIQVIKELESGRFSSILEASRHYEIPGGTTIKAWLKKYGRNHLLPKVIRVEKPDEQSELKRLKAEIKQLKEALADTHCENLLNKAHFDILCKQTGLDPEEVKKKLVTQQSGKRPRQPLNRRKK